VWTIPPANLANKKTHRFTSNFLRAPDFIVISDM
jgi:hypothetical protein